MQELKDMRQILINFASVLVGVGVILFGVDRLERIYAAKQAENQACALEPIRAVRALVVTSRDCPPCRRMKIFTIPTLLAQGYDISPIEVSEFDGKVTGVPTTLFYNERDEVVLTRVGYLTPEQIKLNLKRMRK